ncbi:VirB3 family type IV secretion system protein [Paracoccus sp. PAR01]|uniref:VirB3 family type IV secretion system protein n=1 Tax=Paracoccus sp. PAR01 TaxID=2769282 RepID=UPI001780CDC9|nr:VirB3 family type IV secretion system protein [Paracoccus sp. PAR01]MBD9529589.1 VirB3 family type IV secretion system protein [Paracoccus sp. PAR01]
MERTPVILGLTRQAKLWGLPMPYMLAVAGVTVLPFMWTSQHPFLSLSFLALGPVWYGLARIASAANPNGAQVLRVILQKTPPCLNRTRRKGRRYV